MPNYWRQLLIPWLLSTLVAINVVLAQQQNQPSFEDLNKSFQNLFMQHHHHPNQAAGSFAHNTLTFDHLRALQAHPLVFPPHPAFNYPAGGFGLPNGRQFPMPISVGNQQLVSMQTQQPQQPAVLQPQAQLNVVALQQVQPLTPNTALQQHTVLQQQQPQPQASAITSQGQQLYLSLENSTVMAVTKSQNSSINPVPTQENNPLVSRNFVLAPLTQQKPFAANPLAVFSTSQLRSIPQQQSVTINQTHFPPIPQRIPQQTGNFNFNDYSTTVQPTTPYASSTIASTIPTAKLDDINSNNSSDISSNGINYSSASVTTPPSMLSTTILATITSVKSKLTKPTQALLSSTPLIAESSAQSTMPTVTIAETVTQIAKSEVAEGIDRLKLAQHLSKADLANLLRAANFSTGDARFFLKLVEKVLEDEVSQRIDAHTNSTTSKLELKMSEINEKYNASVNENTSNKNSNISSTPENGNNSVNHQIFSLVIPPIHSDEFTYRKIEADGGNDSVKYSPKKNDQNVNHADDSQNAQIYLIREGIPQLKLAEPTIDPILNPNELINHQLKTANTHLTYSGATEEVVGSDANSSQNSAAKGGTLVEKTQNGTAAKQKNSLAELNRNSYGVRIANSGKDQPRLSSQQYYTPDTIPSSFTPSFADSETSEQQFLAATTADYRTKEQADFDRLLEQLAESYVPAESGTKSAVEQSAQGEENGGRNGLLFRGGGVQNNPSDNGLPSWKEIQNPESNTPSTLSGFSPNSGRHHRISNRHPPHTAFEHLFEDYRYRLSGQNGINDVIKALRNAHIGFFERRVAKFPRNI